jgi:hypothetical protein
VQHKRVGVDAKFGNDKGTRCAINPLMKRTSRDKRSSFATTTEHFAVRARASAAASSGRRSSASAALPVSISKCWENIVAALAAGDTHPTINLSQAG